MVRVYGTMRDGTILCYLVPTEAGDEVCRWLANLPVITEAHKENVKW